MGVGDTSDRGVSFLRVVCLTHSHIDLTPGSDIPLGMGEYLTLYSSDKPSCRRSGIGILPGLSSSGRSDYTSLCALGRAIGEISITGSAMREGESCGFGTWECVAL